MKIAFYLENDICYNTDFSNVLFTNPGVGGTEFEFFRVATLLKQKTNIEPVMILTHSIDSSFSLAPFTIKRNKNEAIEWAVENKFDAIVFKNLPKDISPNKNIKIINWILNNQSKDDLKRCLSYSSGFIHACRSEWKEFLYIKEICRINYYIYNSLPYFPSNLYSRQMDKNSVLFIGALSPEKGAHALTEIWPKVVKKIPDAKLIIAGSGKLYNQDAKLGSFNLTDERYEKILLKPLIENNILDKVEFKNVIKIDENIEMMSHIKIGIANPLGIRETFCLAATDFSRYKIPVIYKKGGGISQTVSNGGFSFHSKRKLVNLIVRLLKNNRLNSKVGNKGYKHVLNTYNDDVICEMWIETLKKIINNQPNKVSVLIKISSFINKCFAAIKYRINKKLGISPYPKFYD